MSTYELARRLADIGWPIAANGLTKVESGDRRVTVDDVVALAVVLGVSPNQLLFPPIVSRPGTHYGVPVVGNVTAWDVDIWRWATGESPLVPLDGTELGEQPGAHEVAEFLLANRPHIVAESTTDSAAEMVSTLADALRLAIERGASANGMRKVLDRAITEAAGGKG